MKTAWLFLVAAIITEVAGTLSMSESGQSGSLWMYGLMWLCIASSYTLLSFALRKIAVGIAIAIWEGLGTALICTISVLFLNETFSLQKLLGLALAGLGILLLHFGEDKTSEKELAPAESKGV